jgi:glycosyltransferase involved in cell wall biosynthesis
VAAEQPNAGHIHFVGELDDQQKWQAYESADLFVLPSYSENFGLVIGEALAAGLPVVTTTATPWTELKEKNCGWCIPPGEKDLEQTLKTAFSTTPEQRKSMGQNGAKWVREEFQWSAVAERFWGEVVSFNS